MIHAEKNNMGSVKYFVSQNPQKGDVIHVKND
jgi:hypothetical protein